MRTTFKYIIVLLLAGTWTVQARAQEIENDYQTRTMDRLVLEADPGESYTSDFCDWAQARVFNAPSDKGDSR